MSEIPWWGLPLIAIVSGVVGAAVAMIVSARDEHVRSRAGRTRRWYTERKDAYIGLMAVFERVVYRLRTGYAAGGREPDPLVYLDEVGPALARVRLLASGPVRSAALAAHLLLEKLHTTGGPAPVPGVEPQKHARELLAQVPLVMHEFEVAVREELDISPTPPVFPDVVVPASRRDRVRSLLRRPAVGQDRD
ncbi:MAG TPA: hypothetical protein VFH03_08815 [Actinoplanes sp.]|nr:hypothetical protein [Actinoplanes sp.]